MEQKPNMAEENEYEDSTAENKNKYTPRPFGHLLLAWVLIAVVLFAFGGVCYWMVAFGRN